jgi:hypothetical protein
MLAICFAAVSLSAQDTKVKSEQKVKTDDGAKVVTLKGCLSGTPPMFTLDHASSAAVASVEKKGDEAKIEANAGTTVGTTGSSTEYSLSPRAGVDLATHIGHMVEVTGVLVPSGSGDVDVKVKDRTKVDREDAPDSKVKSTTKASIDKASVPQMAVTSVKMLSTMCVN